MSIAVASTLKEPVQDTLAFVDNNRRIGITHQYLYFDDPLDPAIQRLAGAADLTIKACDKDHWRDLQQPLVPNSLNVRQILNANSALAMARDAGHDWIAHVDGDEHITVLDDESLLTAMGRYNPAQSILMWALEAVPEQLEYERPHTEITRFKHGKMASEIANSVGLECVFQGDFLRGHLGKTISRVEKVDHLSVHFAHDKSGGKIRPDRQDEICLKHFESCSFSRWKRKWEMRRSSTTNVGLRGNRAAQYELYLNRRDDAAALEEFYKKLYFVSQGEAETLSELGALVEIRCGGSNSESDLLL